MYNLYIYKTKRALIFCLRKMHFGPKPNPFSVQNFSRIEIYFSISILDHFEYLREIIFHTKNPTKNKIPTKVLHMVDCGSSSFIPIKSIGFSDPNQQKIDFYLKQNDSKNLDRMEPEPIATPNGVLYYDCDCYLPLPVPSRCSLYIYEWRRGERKSIKQQKF